MTIELLVGPVGSGKSTYSLSKAKEGYLIVNDDAIVNSFHGGYYKGYDEYLKPFYKDAEYNIILAGAAPNRNVIIDRPCFKKDTRQRYIQIAKSLDISCIAILFKDEGPEIHAERRYNSDNRGLTYEDWFRVARYHHEAFEPISLDEGFNELISYNHI